MTHPIRFRRWLFVAMVGLVTTAARAGDESPETARLLQSTVCILGDVRGGKIEASGFAVPPGTYVLTTAHGLSAATNLRVKLSDGRIFPARLDRIGNERADLALLSVIGTRIEPAPLGSVETVRAGDALRTVGCPAGFDFTLTQGLVSAIRSSDLGYPLIQTDVPVNPGSSGAPLFDRHGRVVGIIKMGAAERERIYFALPIDLGRALIDQVSGERRAWELFNRAVMENRTEEKIRLYREVVALQPSLVEGHYNLGLALERLGRLREAEHEYRESLRLEPRYSAAALNLGVTLYEQKRYSEAVEVYRAALRRSPDFIQVRNNLAEAYRALGENEKARREFRAILARRPDYAPAHYGLAVLYDDELGDRKQAALHYRRYLTLVPDAADASRVREWLRRAERPSK